uniref:PGG domain-containing protein n=1 Tax=Oryza punctata TaxID=4537 RepID=A0A0E0LKP1_ORYPU
MDIYDVAALPMVLEWLNDKKLKTANMRQQEEAGDHRKVATGDLLSRLTCERDNDNGSTPLHLAASMDGLPAPYILIWSPLVLEPSRWAPAARLLLDANVSAAYQADNHGLYPIHVAASAGSMDTVKILLERCPDCATLRDGKGRTFLHVAAEKVSWGVVGYVCEFEGRENARFLSILNAQDDNGDTALHLAVHAQNLSTVRRLIRCQEVRLAVPNKKGMRPIDVSWRRMPLKAYHAWGTANGRVIAHSWELHVVNVGVTSSTKNDTPSPSMLTLTNLNCSASLSPFLRPHYNRDIRVGFHVARGDFRSAGDGGGAAGTPLLARHGSYAFDAFILADALAFVCSFMATSILLYAGMPAFSLNTRFANINFAYSLMMNSGRSLVAALALGLYVVLLPPVGRTIAVAIAADGHAIGPSSSQFGTVWLHYKCGATLYWSFILIFGLPAIRKWARAG